MEGFHDKIAMLCLKHFETLSKSGKPKKNEWTVLSCIVLESEGDFRVVALGTGSKCIGKSKMSRTGDILNDSHAEVVCKRSFTRFLLDRMKNGAVFLHFNDLTNKYRVREGVEFHFFTSHVLCGDAAIFPKGEAEDIGQVIQMESEDFEVPRKVARKGDVFRTGAKCLVGDERQDLKDAGDGYHVVGAVRSKPGRGDPTQSVSCSDKMSRWCHLGVQGAMLSLLLEKPIYLSSFTTVVDTPFSESALERALYDRLGTVELKSPYCRRRLKVGQASIGFSFSKNASRHPSDCSISWCDVKDKSLEVSVKGKRQGVTKKNLNSPSARLKICKLELFKSLVEICEMRGLSFGGNHDLKRLCYKEVKELAVDYNEAWTKLGEGFKVWTRKDNQLLHFFIQ